MTRSPRHRYWHQFVSNTADSSTPSSRLPPGADLAIFRSGLGRPAGSVPKLWPYYTSPVDDTLAQRGVVSDEQEAEHAALTLFGVHQQSQSQLMHREDTSLGAALLVLRNSGQVSPQALDGRVNALAAATSASALTKRLRGLVDQLRTVREPLDYDRLLGDIRAWRWPDRRDRVRRRWALGYRVWAPPNTTSD